MSCSVEHCPSWQHGSICEAGWQEISVAKSFCSITVAVPTTGCPMLAAVGNRQASFAELFFTMILAYVVLVVATKEIPAEWKTKQTLA